VPGPSRYNRKLKRGNDARKARSGGGRTRSEAAFGRSQAAAGKAVSRTNTRVPKANRPRAIRTPLALPEVQTSIERLRQKYGSEAMDRGNREARRVNTEVSQSRDRAERKLENSALRSMPTRGEALKAAPAVRQSTRLNAEGTRVERLAGATQVGNEGLGAVMGAAQRGRIKRRGNQFTTPKVRRTERKVRRAKRELRKARNATRTPRKSLMRAGLDAEQAKVLSTVLRIGRRQGASKKEMLAAVETALVESGIRNLGYGDADSSGWRQERATYYPNPQNVKASAGRFFQETASQGRGAGTTAGQLAQAVQRSAFPDKYDERKGDAAPLLRAFNSAGNASPRAKARLARAESQLEGATSEATKLGIEAESLVTPGVVRNLGIREPENAGVPRRIVRGFKGMIGAAKQLESWALPYVWGGGHGTSKVGDPRQYGGLDCSSTVSHILQRGGIKIPTIVSGSFGQYTKPGPGAITILYNPDHVLMKIGNRYFGTSGTNPGGGPGWLDKSLGDSEMASGKYNIGHIPGFGPDVAKRMNLDPDSYRVFPGMSVDGNTATVTSGGTVSYTPTFSDRPIVAGDGQGQRTPRQLLRRLGYKVTSKGIERTGLAAGISGEGGEEETLSTAEMKRRYGIK